MSLVILQPAGDPAARQHYADTIETPVARTRLAQFLSSEDLAVLDDIYKPTSAVPTWGVTPGVNEGNRRKWERIAPGDVALVSRGGRIFAKAVVTHKTHAPDLALDLWKTDEAGQTWEFVYFLDEVGPVDIPYPVFNEAAGYAPNNVIQGFNVLSEEKSETVIAAFGLASVVHVQPVSEAEYKDLVADDVLDPEKALDGEGRVKTRKEQAFIRRYLFGKGKERECIICGGVFPPNLMIAAHIKKRSQSTPEERLDYKNLVFPMCSLGCDSLFEKGYVAVNDGHIVVSASNNLPADLQKRLATLAGRKTPAWTDGSKKYFDWHRASAAAFNGASP